jgi:hypothetical protein
MTNHFIIIATILFFFLGMIWKKSDWTNAFVKFFLLAIGVWGAIETLMYYGIFIRK